MSKIDKIIEELQICLKGDHFKCENEKYWIEEAIKQLKKYKRMRENMMEIIFGVIEKVMEEGE